MTHITHESDASASDDQPQSAPVPDTAESFAADLRALRLEAGSPTLFSLQHATSISKTVISEAFRGQRLPSARTVDRLLRAMGADPAPWIARRDRLAHTSGVIVADPAILEEALAVPQRSIRVRTAALIAAATFAVGLLVSGGVGFAVASAVVEKVRSDAVATTKQQIMDEPQSPRAQINVHTGIDPALSPCVNDAKVVTSDTRTNNTKIEIIWSNKCYAGWARVTRYDAKVAGNSVTIAIYPETAPFGPDRQSATEPGVQSAYTTLVVRPSPETRLCAAASITLDGTSIDLGDPICT